MRSDADAPDTRFVTPRLLKWHSLIETSLFLHILHKFFPNLVDFPSELRCYLAKRLTPYQKDKLHRQHPKLAICLFGPDLFAVEASVSEFVCVSVAFSVRA